MEIVNSASTKKPDTVLDLFKQEFSSTVIPVFIKSINKVVEFREISVSEQKSLTKTQIENQNRPATIYRAFNSLIESLLLTKHIDVQQFTEADRYNILFNLYQTAFLDKPQEFTCNHCKAKFSMSVDAAAINQNFADLNTTDRVYTLQDASRYYTFTCNYPTLRRLTAMLDVFQRKYMSTPADSNVSTDVIAMMESVDYVNAFIKTLTIERINKATPAITAQFENMNAEDVINTLSILPQHIMLAEKTGITDTLLTDFITPINSVFAKHTCPNCGEIFNGQIGSVTDFLA